MDRFSLRRAVERLRDGLFDPVALQRLTVEEERIKKIFSKGLGALERGGTDALCICGSYGQGKSHTIAHLSQWALAQGFAASTVQLDVREVPFHQFSAVYQTLMERLSLPDGQTFAQAWENWAGEEPSSLEAMPHRFKMILKAMRSKNQKLPPKESRSKKHQEHRPREYADWLERALEGHEIPVAYLKRAFEHREVEGYREHPLACRGNEPYLRMVRAFGQLLREVGYKGWLLFFDEAESIAQGRLGQRVKSYPLLDQFFQGGGSLFPVFAFTDDFFDQARDESYGEGSPFPKNYAEAWSGLTILRLQDFSSEEWDSLLGHLMQLYSEAYRVSLPQGVRERLRALLDRLKLQETRLKLRALVHKLDVETQQHLLAEP